MSHILGVYWAPEHMRQGDIDYIAQLGPPAVRILEPDVETMNRAHHNAPGALLLPRDWALSEQHDDVRFDPAGTGIRHAQDWRVKIDKWHSQGMVAQDHQIVVVGINEPRVWDDIPSVVAYNVAFLDECLRLRLRACALNLGVGWPANTGPDTPPNWEPYAPVRAAIQRGNHFLVVHEYWYRSGPLDGAGWWAWRINKCPWDVPIMIGETGVDNYVDTVRWENEGKPPRGWLGNINPDQYAAQMVQYAQGLDKRVFAILPFLTDYRSNQWQSFDTEQAHGAFLARRNEMQPKATYTVNLPIISTPPTTVITDQTDSNWTRARAFVRKWEGGLSLDPEDHGNWTGGRKGQGELRGTNFGISAASYPTLDIRNLTMQQADDIYKRDYWQASGADKLPWPYCLLAFDTAVLHGVGTSQKWQREAGNNPYLFAAKRLRTYTKLDNWSHFGAGWTNRVSDLLEEAGKA